MSLADSRDIRSFQMSLASCRKARRECGAASPAVHSPDVHRSVGRPASATSPRNGPIRGELQPTRPAKCEEEWAGSGAGTPHRPPLGREPDSAPFFVLRIAVICVRAAGDSTVPSKQPAETDFFHCRSISHRVSQRICPTTPFLLLCFLVFLGKSVNYRRRGVNYAANNMRTPANLHSARVQLREYSLCRLSSTVSVFPHQIEF